MSEPTPDPFAELGRFWRTTAEPARADAEPGGEMSQVVRWTQTAYAGLQVPRLVRRPSARERARRRLRWAAAAGILIAASALSFLAFGAGSNCEEQVARKPAALVHADVAGDSPTISAPGASVVRADSDQLELTRPGVRVVLVQAVVSSQ